MLKESYRLSEIKADRDIVSLSKAQFPGPHCPLFGAIMTGSYIKDLAMLIVGTEECTYYGKDFSMMRQGGNDRVYSAVLEQQDITFGCEDGLREIIRQIDREESPTALMVVTTCVVELIGEDVESILLSMADEVSMTLMTVKTEHFRCNSHIDGMKKTFAQMAKVMTARETKAKTVNVLGYKYSGIEDSELYECLESQSIQVAMTIPTAVTVAQMADATSAALNIVVDETALDLARSMEATFGIPYVDFGMGVDVEVVKKAYREVEKHLNIDIEAFIQKRYDRAKERIAQGQKKLAGKSFIYGNTPFDCFEFSDFLVGIGMEPKIIQCRELLEKHRAIMASMGERWNPYILRMANIAPLRRIYDSIGTDYYFGHESPMVLSKHGITQVVFDSCAKKTGFEKIEGVLEAIIEEKGMFSLMMGGREEKGDQMKKDDAMTAFREKVERMTQVPPPMKAMLLGMKEVPEAMREAIMNMADDAPLTGMMGGGHKGKMGGHG